MSSHGTQMNTESDGDEPPRHPNKNEIQDDKSPTLLTRRFNMQRQSRMTSPPPYRHDDPTRGTNPE